MVEILFAVRKIKPTFTSLKLPNITGGMRLWFANVAPEGGQNFSTPFSQQVTHTGWRRHQKNVPNVLLQPPFCIITVAKSVYGALLLSYITQSVAVVARFRTCGNQLFMFPSHSLSLAPLPALPDTYLSPLLFMLSCLNSDMTQVNSGKAEVENNTSCHSRSLYGKNKNKKERETELAVCLSWKLRDSCSHLTFFF